MIATLLLIGVLASFSSATLVQNHLFPDDQPPFRPFLDEMFRETVCNSDVDVRPEISVIDRRQRLLQPNGNLRRRFCRVLEDIAFSLPSGFTAGAVNCTIDGLNVDFVIPLTNADGETGQLDCGFSVNLVNNCGRAHGSHNAAESSDAEESSDTDDRKRQQVQPLPCALRTTRADCMAGCDGGVLAECTCLFDSPEFPQSLEVGVACPPGAVCCFNMPCNRFGYKAFDPSITEEDARDQCEAGGGQTDTSAGNCEFDADVFQSVGVDTDLAVPSYCNCAGNLDPVSTIQEIGAIVAGSTNSDINAPFDCTCNEFGTPAEWFAETGDGVIGDLQCGPPPGPITIPNEVQSAVVTQLANTIESVNRQLFLRQCPWRRRRLRARRWLAARLFRKMCRAYVRVLRRVGVPCTVVSITDSICDIATYTNSQTPSSAASVLDADLVEISAIEDVDGLDSVEEFEAMLAPASTYVLSVATIVAAVALIL